MLQFVSSLPGYLRWQGWTLAALGGDLPCSGFTLLSSSCSPRSSQDRALPEAGEDADGQQQGCQGRGVAAGVKHLHGDKIAFLEGKAPAE